MRLMKVYNESSLFSSISNKGAFHVLLQSDLAKDDYWWEYLEFRRGELTGGFGRKTLSLIIKKVPD